jgi:hypothetical protein
VNPSQYAASNTTTTINARGIEQKFVAEDVVILLELPLAAAKDETLTYWK